MADRQCAVSSAEDGVARSSRRPCRSGLRKARTGGVDGVEFAVGGPRSTASTVGMRPGTVGASEPMSHDDPDCQASVMSPE